MKLRDVMLKIGDTPSKIPTIIFIAGLGLIGVGTLVLLSKHANDPETVAKETEEKASKEFDEAHKDEIDDLETDNKDSEQKVTSSFCEFVNKEVDRAVEGAKYIRERAVKMIAGGAYLTVLSTTLRKIALNCAYSKYLDVKRAGRKLVREKMDRNDCIKQALYAIERAANELKKNPDTFDQAVGMQSAYCTLYSAIDPKKWRNNDEV